MDNSFKIPFYAKSALIFVSVFAFAYILYIGQDIIIPIVCALIFAILLNPFVNSLVRRKIGKLAAITPKIVAPRVEINALISVIGVLIGSAVWGISGMYLSIPIIAILKAICDHIDPLNPRKFLPGNIVPTAFKFSFINRKLKK